MSNQATSKDLPSVTFSQALAAGHTDSGWLAGPTTDQSGRARVLASHSVSPEKVAALQTNAIYGPLFGGSSPSAGLQWSLASRLRAALASSGSPEYTLTWICSVIDCPGIRTATQRLTLYRLAASARRISDNGSGGWATPRAEDAESAGMRHSRGKADTLSAQAGQDLSGWPTPAVQNADGGPHPNGRTGHYFTLQTAAKMTGWPTPQANEQTETSESKVARGAHAGLNLPVAAQAAGWPTASSRDHKGGYKNGRTRDGKLVSNVALDVAAQGVGQTQPGTTAETAKQDGYRLNPAFSLWLMGYPISWAMTGFKALLKQKSRYIDYRRALLKSLEEC